MGRLSPSFRTVSSEGLDDLRKAMRNCFVEISSSNKLTLKQIQKCNIHRSNQTIKFLSSASSSSLSIILFCSSSDIPECDFIASIILNSEECENAVAIFDCALNTSCPKDVRIITPFFRLIRPIFNSLELVELYCFGVILCHVFA
jgi:hypothetical protein